MVSLLEVGRMNVRGVFKVRLFGIHSRCLSNDMHAQVLRPKCYVDVVEVRHG